MIADEFTQLVFHVLAHVRVPGPGNVHDRRYVAWAAARFDSADQQLLVHDAALLARTWNDVLHRFCELHAGLVDFRACCGRSLAELRASEVANAELLVALRELPSAELMYATLALLAPGFTRVLAELGPALAQADASVAGWIERMAAFCPGLADARVELVWALGMHGRALPGRILVGAPADWNGCAPARQAVLAAHEHTVARIGGDDYVAEEWAALTELAHRLRAADPELRQAHREWLASLNLSSLLAAAVARRYLAASEAQAIERDVNGRPERLSAARAGA